MMLCPNCGQRTVENARYCHHCAFPLELAEDRLGLPQGYSTEVDPGDAAVEMTIWEGRYAPRSMVISHAIASAATLGLFLLAVSAFNHTLKTTGFVVLMGAALVCCSQLMRVFGRVLRAQYRLTNQRLFVCSGVVKQQKAQLALARVEDVRVHQNIVSRLLDVGSVEVVSTDKHLARIVMEGIKRPDTVAEAVRVAARLMRERESAVASQIPAHEPVS